MFISPSTIARHDDNGRRPQRQGRAVAMSAAAAVALSGLAISPSSARVAVTAKTAVRGGPVTVPVTSGPTTTNTTTSVVGGSIAPVGAISFGRVVPGADASMGTGYFKATGSIGATITARLSSGSWQSAMTVVAFTNADTTLGTVVGASAGSGAPTASLTTTRAGSWVWGVGADWTTAISRSVGANQTLVDQYLPPAGDTYWLQRQNTSTATSGTVVTVNDTSPTIDSWDLAVVEILASP